MKTLFVSGTDTEVGNPVTEVTEEDRNFVLSNINARLDLVEGCAVGNLPAECDFE